MKNILVIGSINMDLSVQVERMPKPGETLAGHGLKISAGGKGANQAAAAAKLGAPVRMLGAVGKDGYGSQLRAALGSCGVDCTAVADVQVPTGLAMITVCGGENCIIIDHGANGTLLPSIMEEHASLFEWADILVLQLEIPMETVIYAAQQAKAAGACVILNPAPMEHPLSHDLLDYVDILVPNEHEASLLLDGVLVETETAVQAARKLYEKFGTHVIITLGSQGSIYYDGTTVIRQMAAQVTPVDTTAAGDSFIGGLCFSLAEGKTMAEALRFATAVSAVTVTRSGAIFSLPTRQEAESVLIGLATKTPF